MTSAENWKARAVAWKKSGQRSEDFSRGLGIDPGKLRSLTSKLGLSKPRKNLRVKAMQILPRLARVETRPGLAKEEEPIEIVQKSTKKAGVAVRIGQTRVDVYIGFDAGTLRSVLTIVEELGQ
jgi:hypothetical protein